MQARSQPWVSNKMSFYLMCPIYSAVTHEDNRGLGTPSKVIHIILLLLHVVPCRVVFISAPNTNDLLI